MYEQVEKLKENKSKAVANSVAQKKSNKTQGLDFDNNRPEAALQRKLEATVNNSSQLSPNERSAYTHSRKESANNDGVKQLKTDIIQRATPAEGIAETNPDHEEDPDYALIGTDNQYASPLAVELQYCIANNMKMPAYLAKYLQETKQDWGQEVNNNWMKLMTDSQKIFVLTHPGIAELLTTNGVDGFKRSRKNNGKGTWKEVQHLLDNGYRWYAEAQIFLPPTLSPGRFDAWNKIRMEENGKLKK